MSLRATIRHRRASASTVHPLITSSTIAFHSRDLDQRRDERRQAVGLALQPLGRRVVIVGVPRELDGDVQPRQRRS
jgi:hypothetical protein